MRKITSLLVCAVAILALAAGPALRRPRMPTTVSPAPSRVAGAMRPRLTPVALCPSRASSWCSLPSPVSACSASDTLCGALRTPARAPRRAFKAERQSGRERNFRRVRFCVSHQRPIVHVR